MVKSGSLAQGGATTMTLCVLSGDVFPLDVVGRIVVMCLTAGLVVPVFARFFKN
jgi:hypothetical protein